MSAPSYQRIRQVLLPDLPKELVDALMGEYHELKQNYFLGRHEPAELNAAKFCEIVLRVLEQETTGAYTPLGTQIKNIPAKFRAFENVTAKSDSVRFHIPSIASAIYGIRNKRGVGHVGGDVNPNLADATVTMAGVDWILAELVRMHHNCTMEEAQSIVDELVQRKLFLVYSIREMKRVLNPRLSYPNQTLLILASESPRAVQDRSLFDWVEHSNFSAYKKTVLESLHRQRLIEYSNGTCTILPTGLAFVEREYPKWVRFEAQQ